MVQTTKAKVLLYDLEVTRDRVEGYGNKWEFKVVKVLKYQELMCYAYKWLGEKKVHYVSRHYFATYREFVQSLADVLSEADIAIAHNGLGFDNKMSNRFFIKDDILPPAPYKSIDTLRVARGTFKFMSNSLRDLGEYLGLGTKAKITYAEIETDFMENPTPKVERLMSKYNRQDVVLLERIYLKMRPFIKNHPNLGDIAMLDGVCPKCGSEHLQKRGHNTRRAGKVQRYQCMNCGGWCNEANLKKTGRTVNG